MAEEQEQRPVLRLASASPRRRQLLDLIGVPHVVTPADIDEAVHPGEAPAAYVLRLASEKAAAVWMQQAELPVFAADTTVVVGGEIFGKPENETECVGMLRKLSGRGHQVYTGIALRTRSGLRAEYTVTEVQFRALSDADMRAYWASGEPLGKAGAYAIQGLGAVFISGISGSYTGVMGLPLFETARMLRGAGIPVWNGALATEGER